MDHARDIRDYELLAAVRRRRNESLQAEVRMARAEHEHCLTRQSASNAALKASLQVRNVYSEQIRARTAAGRTVRLGELDNARGHGVVLQAGVDAAADACRHAASEVDAAITKCRTVSRQLAVNEARVRSLVEQADRWRRAALSEMEEREEDERSDAGSIRI